MKGTWQGSGTWQSSGPGRGPLVILAVIAAVVFLGSGAVTAAVHALTVLVIAGAVAVPVGVVSVIALAAHRTRSERPGGPITTQPVYRVTPDPRPGLEGSHKPAIEPGREVHLHLNVTAEQLAAILRHYSGE